MLRRALEILAYRGSLRAAAARRIARGLPMIPYPIRLGVDAVERPHYGYCVFHAAQLAKRLDRPAISVIEFGVAGGNGLLNLESHAIETARHVGVAVEIYGFDTGSGLPPPIDYRDQPYHWRDGSFAMDQARLSARLRFAKLVIGRISDTLPGFRQAYDPAPVGAIAIDLDYYSSTMEAFAIFDLAREIMLPRVYLYFDDVVGGEGEMHSSFTGERLAISDFNRAHERQKISPAFHLRSGHDHHGSWVNKVYIYHDFDHSDYCRFTNTDANELQLN